MCLFHDPADLMTKVTLDFGRSKAKITRAIKKGRLSFFQVMLRAFCACVFLREYYHIGAFISFMARFS